MTRRPQGGGVPRDDAHLRGRLRAILLLLAALAGCRTEALLGNRPDGLVDASVADAAVPPRRSFVVTAGGPGADVARSIALDRAGNIFIAGSFSGTVHFGAHALTATQAQQSFVAKLDPRAEFLWAVALGGIGNDRPVAIAVDGAGNAFVATSFTGRFALEDVVYEAKGPSDLLVVKLAPAGQLVWAVTSLRGDNAHEDGLGIAVDAAGRSTIVGTHRGEAKLGPFSLTGTGAEIFVTRLDAGGRFLWALSAGGAGYDLGNAVALDDAGHAYLAGHFLGAARFGAFQLEVGLPPLGGCVVAKVDPSGKDFLWASQVSDSNCNGAALGPGGSLLVTGALVTSKGFRPFVAALEDTAGKLLWAKDDLPLGAAPSRGNAIACNAAGQIVVTGYQLPKGSSAGDTFVHRLDAAGAVLSSAAVIAPGDDRGNAVALDAAGNAYVAGAFSGSAKLGDEIVQSLGGSDLYVWKLPP